MHSYTAYGLHIRSALPLPELTAVPAAAAADVVISRGDFSPAPRMNGESGLYISVGTDEVRYHWPHFGSFIIRAGQEIHYKPLLGAEEETVRPPLLGVVMGTLLHQRGLFTLHASAVSVNGDAVAFIGQKGAGKSTTAAAMQARDHPLLTDDVLALDFADDDSIRVRPAFPQLKLRPEAAAALGYEPTDLAPLGNGLEKRLLCPTGSFTMHPVPLKRIYLLDRGTELASERITGGAAFSTLMSQTYAPRFLGSNATTPEHFQQCQRVAQQVPLYRLTCPDDLSKLDAIAQFVESAHA